MKIFLTGGTGFIGHALTQSMLKLGWEVTVLARNPDQAARVPGATYVKGDILDPKRLREVMQGFDCVIHNAGRFATGLNRREQQEMRRINVEGTNHVLEIAHENKIPRTVYVSTVGIYSDTEQVLRDETYVRQHGFTSPYEQTKTEAHEVALQWSRHGLPLVIVCPSQVIGPNDHSPYGYFLRLYLNNWMPPLAWRKHIRTAQVHVDDLAEGIALATQKGRIGETYILAGEAASKPEYMTYWKTQPGGFLPGIYAPDWMTRLLFSPMPLLLRSLGLPPFISPDLVDADVWRLFSSEKARRELGWTYRSNQELWQDTVSRERALQQLPGRKGFKARLLTASLI